MEIKMILDEKQLESFLEWTENVPEIVVEDSNLGWLSDEELENASIVVLILQLAEKLYEVYFLSVQEYKEMRDQAESY